jgi:cell division protein FtsB
MKKKWKLNKRFFMLVFAVLFLYVGVCAFNQWREYREIKAKTNEQNQEIDAANRRIQKLQDTIDYADTQEFIESVAREKLGWVKKGETRYVLDEQ